MDLFKVLKNYIILIRAYSIIDVLLLLLCTRMLAVIGPLGGVRPTLLHDCVAALITLCLWGVLTLALEAKHKHSYREAIAYKVPAIFLAVASCAAFFYNPQALVSIFFVGLFTYCYIKKETNAFWGMTSSLWRGLYEVALFLSCWSLYAPLGAISLREICVAIVIFCFYLSRNLIADVRDVAFDRLTFVVFCGAKKSYLVALSSFIVGTGALLIVIPNVFVVVPAVAISAMLLFHDDGFMLHRLSIMVTSVTFVNVIFFLKGASLLYPNMLFLGIMANFFFYEKVARPSNPVRRVPSEVRFLFGAVLDRYNTNPRQCASNDHVTKSADRHSSRDSL